MCFSGTMPGCSGPTATACPSPVIYGRSNSSSLTSSLTSSSLTSSSTSRLGLRFRMPEVIVSRNNRLTSSSVSPSSSSPSRYYPLASRPIQGITSRTSYDVSSHISPSRSVQKPPTTGGGGPPLTELRSVKVLPPSK